MVSILCLVRDRDLVNGLFLHEDLGFLRSYPNLRLSSLRHRVEGVPPTVSQSLPLGLDIRHVHLINPL